MVTSQPHRSSAVQAWWAHTGSTNRGFVSLDPERQREVDSDAPAPKRPSSAFTFDVRRAAASAQRGAKTGTRRRKTPGGSDGGSEPPSGKGSRRRAG